jgi:hypothetical protein
VERTGEGLGTPTGAPVDGRTFSAVRWYSIGLVSGAVGTGIALIAAGASIPPLGPVLLLAIAAALSVNRVVLFPTEHAATAEAAVLLAAVVGFAGDAAYLGPLAVALLVGPLDALHWEQRSFVRMAYNAGNRGLATLAAAGAFAATQHALGTATAAWVVTLFATTAAFVLVDEGLSVVLLRLHGERFISAVIHVFDVDAIVIPVALLGATSGILAGEVGWLATVVALLPIAFIPELLTARAGVRSRAVRDAAALCAALAILSTIALVTPVSGTAALAILCMLAIALGVEVAPHRGALVPPLVALVLIPACAVLDDDRLRLGAVVVALVATATSWWCEHPIRPVRLLAALAVALGAALAAAQVAMELPRSMSGIAIGALIAGVVFELITVMPAPGRSRHGVALVWLVPVIGTAVAAAAVWRSMGNVGALVTAAFGTAALVGWASWGAPAWRSRVAIGVARRAPAAVVLAMPALLASAALGAAVVGVSVAEHVTAVAWAWIAAGLGEAVVATSAAGIRQWRFAPWPRRRGLATMLVVAIVLVVVAAPLATRGSPWGPAVVAAAMALVLFAARGPARRVRETSPDGADEASVP